MKKRETRRDRERQREERQTQKVIKQSSFQADAEKTWFQEVYDLAKK